jgi:hypothetical protein
MSMAYLNNKKRIQKLGTRWQAEVRKCFLQGKGTQEMLNRIHKRSSKITWTWGREAAQRQQETKKNIHQHLTEAQQNLKAHP